MNIVICESQKKILLFEENSNKITERLKSYRSFASEVIRETQKQFKLDLKFLLGWGSAIGGIIHPLNEYVAGEFNYLNNSDIFLIVVGVTTILFFSTKESVTDILRIIKEKKLEKEFSHVLEKGKELKTTFVKFIESLNLGFQQITNILAYAFLIPILPMIYEMSVDGELDPTKINMLIKRLIGSLSVGMSGIIIRELVKKIIKRFSSS